MKRRQPHLQAVPLPAGKSKSRGIVHFPYPNSSPIRFLKVVAFRRQRFFRLIQEISMAIRVRSIYLSGQDLAVPKWVFRDGPGWRIDIDRRRIAGTRFRRYIPDSGRPPSVSLQEAVAAIQECPVHHALDGRLSPSPRKSIRQFVLRRELLHHHFAFTLSIDPSKSAWLRPWMRLFLGTDNTVDQERIDVAIAVLTARWLQFRLHAANHSVVQALDQEYADLPPATAVQASLEIDDLLLWTGRATGIRFSPAADILE